MLIFNYKRFYSNINGAIDNYKKKGHCAHYAVPQNII